MESSTKLREGLPEKCRVACSCAVSKLEDISLKLHTGSIKVLELQMIEKKQQRMKQLLISTCMQPQEEGSSVDKTIVDQRVEEFKTFKEQQASLVHLCGKISSKIKGKVHVVTQLCT